MTSPAATAADRAVDSQMRIYGEAVVCVGGPTITGILLQPDIARAPWAELGAPLRGQPNLELRVRPEDASPLTRRSAVQIRGVTYQVAEIIPETAGTVRLQLMPAATPREARWQ
jgi:hypothetical protein